MSTTNTLQQTIESLFARFKDCSAGGVATYIPELARADPRHFAVCLATVDGSVYCVGDSDVGFTIQSISKPFVYGLALEDHGAEVVMRTAGVEPSGEAFNAISLEPGTGRPRNPMINAGAIATAGLIGGATPEARLKRMMAMFSGHAGRTLEVDEAVYESERETGHRNRAIGHLLRNAGILEGDVDEVVNRYFRQCSVRVTARDLALMAATLANGGANPATGEHVLAAENVERVLSVMSSCGMYDAAGAWMYRVGMPAKSGVAGGIIAVLPGQFGVGIYSPRLDPAGNSVRGVGFCEALSSEFGLHLLRPPLSLASVVRSVSRLTEVRSRRHRPPAELAVLAESGPMAVVYGLQGPLVFGTAEIVLRTGHQNLEPGQIVILDCKRVTNLEAPTAQLFGNFAAAVAAAGGVVGFAHIVSGGGAAGAIRAGARGAEFELFEDVDAAIEWAEESLLRRAGIVTATDQLTFGDHPLLDGLDEDEVAALEAISEAMTFRAGEGIVALGAASDALFLIAGGKVAVSLPAGEAGPRHRLASLGPGTTFGEMAMVTRAPRTADVRAETDTLCYAIDLDALDAAARLAPGLRLKLVENIARDLAGRLSRANIEISALAS